ncbi:MAG: efflux RND transporter periplasmic adaptor subunit [Desulfobacteraceae bacterium]|jgi:RND family efflux transporter MFP subunit|nr:efflux RND transporter periplasmic adaptor subunit [Desulfobacteraceae bacterium]
MKEIHIRITTGNVLKRIIISITVLTLGIVGMTALGAMRTPPAETRPPERTLKVAVQTAAARDVPVSIVGYGEVRAVNEVSIAPEVSGRVEQVHPRLEVGEIVAAGELLFEVDERNYRAALDEARAGAAQLQSAVTRLKKQQALDGERLAAIDRSRDLARAEYERLLILYEQHSVGTRSAVDGAERAFNTAADQADQLAQAVALYPLQIRETESRLAAAQAALTLASVNLARCRVTAPFTGRVKQAAVEAGQFVSPGQTAVTLADDRLLEIQVPLDSRDARHWLLFDAPTNGPQTSWFNGLQPVPVRIRWTEDREDHVWSGRLQRVVRFDPDTRTLTVAVHIAAEAAFNTTPDALPLVDGMFCQVEIPGRIMENVVPVPRWAVSLNSTVYVARDGRLKTVPVSVARVEGDKAFIAEGLSDGDLIVTTRLVDPLENSLLEITSGDGGKAAS